MGEPIVINEQITIPESAISISTARASGPGGQNVNKVASKVDVRVDLSAVEGLPADALARLLARAKNRLDAEGKLQIISQRTRDQAKNLADAYEKIRELVAAALVAPVARRPTRPSRAAVKRRLTDKKITGDRKRSRSARPDVE